MGCFGYICNGCKTSVRYGEEAVLKHIRHGVVKGEATGTYDSYGGVEENDDYRGHHDGLNGHMSIHESEFNLLDSIHFYDYAKIYMEKPILWMQYRAMKGIDDLSESMYKEWESLPYYKDVLTEDQTPLSGVEAWHTYCYNRATEETKAKHIIADSDPDQSWGKPRKKYS